MMQPLWLPQMYCERCDVYWEPKDTQCWLCSNPGEQQQRLLPPHIRLEETEND